MAVLIRVVTHPGPALAVPPIADLDDVRTFIESGRTKAGAVTTVAASEPHIGTDGLLVPGVSLLSAGERARLGAGGRPC